MLEKESQAVRAAILVLLMASMPVESNIDDEKEPFLVNSWTKTVIQMVIEELQLSTDYFDGYVSLLKTCYRNYNFNTLTYESDNSNAESLNSIIKKFKNILISRSNETSKNSEDDQDIGRMSNSVYTSFVTITPVNKSFCIRVVIEIMVYFVTNLLYDSRGRVIVRNLAALMECSPIDVLLCEHILANSLNELLSNNNNMQKSSTSNSKEPKDQTKRYLKIGAASIGAGALLAITGGLAAPALAAAAVVVFGTSATAIAVGSIATVTILSTVFGTAGAGLAGYKMMRRTRGLQEFEFEPHGPTGNLAVMIMISGWMNEEDDYKRVFGILPSNSAIQPLERLIRFYLQHNPTKLENIEVELELYMKDPVAYQTQLLDIYNIDIELEDSLIPCEFPSSISKLWRQASPTLPDDVAYMCDCLEKRQLLQKENHNNNKTNSNHDSQSNHQQSTHVLSHDVDNESIESVDRGVITTHNDIYSGNSNNTCKLDENRKKYEEQYW